MHKRTQTYREKDQINSVYQSLQFHIQRNYAKPPDDTRSIDRANPADSRDFFNQCIKSLLTERAKMIFITVLSPDISHLYENQIMLQVRPCLSLSLSLSLLPLPGRALRWRVSPSERKEDQESSPA